jgi:predicted transcriptional regulator
MDDAEERGHRLLVAALAVCATGRQTASVHLCKEARDQLCALHDILKAKDVQIARLREALKKIRDDDRRQDENRHWEMQDGYYAKIARAALAEDDTPS